MILDITQHNVIRLYEYWSRALLVWKHLNIRKLNLFTNNATKVSNIGHSMTVFTHNTNRGTSVTTPFAPIPSGKRPISVLRSWISEGFTQAYA